VSRLLGHRGTFLLMFGVIYLSIGAGIANVDPSPVQQDGLRFLIAITSDYQTLGWLWAGGGLVAAVFAFVPPWTDRWGFYALMLPAIAWAGSYAVAAAVGRDPLLVLAGLVYSALAVAVGTSAAWPEPTRAVQQ
jgi:hypothetical protein